MKNFIQKLFNKKSLESNADFKSTYCENILSNLYSLLLSYDFNQQNIVNYHRNYRLYSKTQEKESK